MAVDIIPYRLDDLRWFNPALILPPEFLEEIRTELSPPDGCLLVAFDPDTSMRIIGCAGFRKIRADVCEAKRVVVGWDHQGQGVGVQLMTALLQEARQRGYRTMQAAAPAGVPALVAFYERMQFRRIEGDGPADIVRFERVLNEEDPLSKRCQR
jgi:GNAT superfamily N-acetyltransferase